MIQNWLDYQGSLTDYVFNVIRVTEKKAPDETLINFLKESLLLSYRPLKFYEYHFDAKTTTDEIRQYIQEKIIPKADNQFDKNVRQGDWGEVLAGLIVTYFENLVVPINKIQWKFNKDKAVFGTDLIAFNSGDRIREIHYFEVKTRVNPQTKEGEEPNRAYVSIIAHGSLKKDADSPTDSIADFLERLYFEKEDFENAGKFKDIIKNPRRYQRYYEIYLIVEGTKFDDKILDELNSLPPQLNPLKITVVLVDNLANLVQKTWTDIEDALISRLNIGGSDP